jgi:hypothetical protein
MKIYFADPEYDGQFLRTLDYAPLGAQIGEAWAIAAQIRTGLRRAGTTHGRPMPIACTILAVKSHAARASGQRPQRLSARIKLLSCRVHFHVCAAH